MEQQDRSEEEESASFGPPPPAVPQAYELESAGEEAEAEWMEIQRQRFEEQRRAREEQSARARLLTPKNATRRRGVLPAAPRDPLRLAQSIVAASRQFAALPPSPERRSLVRWVATHRDIVEAIAGSIERGATSFDGSSRPKTDEVALVRVFEWLFVDAGPHACLAFLDDKKPDCGGGAAVDVDGGVSDADKREAFARLNQAVAAVAVKRLRECRFAIPELLPRMWARVWQAAAAASGGDDGTGELVMPGLLSAISRVYERLIEHRCRDFFSCRFEPIDDELFIRFVVDSKSVAIVTAGLELINDAMHYRFGEIFGPRTWTHLLVDTVIHPDHCIRRLAASFLGFRYCPNDLRVEICQLRMSRLRQEEDPTVKAHLLKSLSTTQSGSDMSRARLEPPFTEMQDSNGKVARAATALLSRMVCLGGVSLDQEQVARAIEIVHPGLLPQVRREGSLTAQLLCFLANTRPDCATSADAAHLPQDLRERVAATSAGFAKYRERALGLVSQMCVLERNATKLLVVIHDWLQADGPDKWHRASGLVALSALVRASHKGRPGGQQPPIEPPLGDEEDQGDNTFRNDDYDGYDDYDDDDNGERRHAVPPPHYNVDEEEDGDDVEHLEEHIKQALGYTPYVIDCLQDPEPLVRYGACEAVRWMWKWSSPGQRLTASNLLVDLAAAGTDQSARFVQHKAFATLQGLLEDAPYDGEEDIIFASCVARLQRHDGPEASSLHLVMQLARAGGLRDPKERTMELAELMMPVLVAKMRHVRGVELVSCMLAAIEYILPLGRRCPLAREASQLVGQRWAEVFPHAKHFRLPKPAKNFARRHALLADRYDALEPQP